MEHALEVDTGCATSREIIAKHFLYNLGESDKIFIALFSSTQLKYSGKDFYKAAFLVSATSRELFITQMHLLPLFTEYDLTLYANHDKL